MNHDCGQLRVEMLRDVVPVKDGTYDVVAMPMDTQGQLCQCHGKATPPEPYMSSGGVRAICRPVGGTPPTADEVFSATTEVAFPDSSDEYRWNLDQKVRAYCADAPTANNNTLYVVAWWSKFMTWPPVTVTESFSVSFKGKRAMTCGKGVAPAPAKQEMSGMPDIMPNEAGPWDLVGDALEYRHLSVTNLVQGNRLMRGGVPLKARRIAVAARDVSWQYGLGIPTLITKPLGEYETAPDGWFFKGAPKGALVIWQGETKRRVISSDCLDKPDVLELDPTKPIYVQVNYYNLDMFNRSGSFGLRVRVID